MGRPLGGLGGRTGVDARGMRGRLIGRRDVVQCGARCCCDAGFDAGAMAAGDTGGLGAKRSRKGTYLLRESHRRRGRGRSEVWRAWEVSGRRVGFLRMSGWPGWAQLGLIVIIIHYRGAMLGRPETRRAKVHITRPHAHLSRLHPFPALPPPDIPSPCSPAPRDRGHRRTVLCARPARPLCPTRIDASSRRPSVASAELCSRQATSPSQGHRIRPLAILSRPSSVQSYPCLLS